MKKFVKKFGLLLIILVSTTSCTIFYASRDRMISHIQEVTNSNDGMVEFYKVEGTGAVKDVASFNVFYNQYYNQCGIYMEAEYDNTSYELQILFPQMEDDIVSHIHFYYYRTGELFFETIGTIRHKTYDDETMFTVYGYEFHSEYTSNELNSLMNLCNTALFHSIMYFGKYYCPEIDMTLRNFRFNTLHRIAKQQDK